MKKMKLFVPITKVEKTADDTRMVFGVLALEEVDKDKEVMDYDKSKKFFEAWNANYREKTKAMGVEESCGNLRAMHKSISAGAFRDMAYDDAAKTITVAAEVVDKDEVQKVDKGVYTGFSIGARRVESEFDTKLKALRWVADPYEGSIVDNPCMYSAAITAVKVAKSGSDDAEIVKFVGKPTEATEKVAKGLWYVSRMADLLESLMWLASDVQYEAEYEMDGSPIPDELKAQCKSLAETLKKYVVEEADEAVAAMNKAEGATTMEKKPKAAGVIAEPGVRPKQSEPPADAGAQPSTEKTETSAAAAATPKTEKKAPNKAELLAAVEGIRQQLEALDAEPVATVSGETPASATTVDAGKVAGAAGETVTKAQFDALKGENDALKADVAAAKESAEKANAALAEIQKLLERPMPTAAKLKGAAAVGKEDDNGTTEKSDADKLAEAQKTAKETGNITGVLKHIHANGPTQRR